MFDTEHFLEKIEENRPTVIFLSGGVVEDVYVPNTEGSVDYLVIETDDDEEITNDKDVFTEILDTCGYTAASPATVSDYVVSTDECECLDDDD